MLIVVLGMLAVGLLLSAVDGIEDFADFPDDGPDKLEGDDGNDRFVGLGGDDELLGKGGDDTLLGVMVMTSWKGTLARICCSEVMMTTISKGAAATIAYLVAKATIS
jgi:Ca2+-binding RTX toxin-like protein